MDCPICYDCYTTDSVAMKTVCGHVMCSVCLDMLTKEEGAGSCPMCRQKLWKADCKVADIISSNTDNCSKHSASSAVSVCSDCMQLLCDDCTLDHSHQHKIHPVEEAKRHMDGIIAPIAKAKVEKIKLATRQARVALATEVEKRQQSVMDLGQQMKSLVDAFVCGQQGAAAELSPMMLQELYESLTQQMVAFTRNDQQASTGSSASTSNSANEIEADLDNMTLNDQLEERSNSSSTVVDGRSSIINNVEHDNDAEEEDYADDLVYGFLPEDDDYSQDDDDDFYYDDSEDDDF